MKKSRDEIRAECEREGYPLTKIISQDDWYPAHEIGYRLEWFKDYEKGKQKDAYIAESLKQDKISNSIAEKSVKIAWLAFVVSINSIFIAVFK